MKIYMKQYLLMATLLFATGFLLSGTAFASGSYPSRTVQVINEFGPGGGTDRFIRAIGEPFSKITGHSLVGISVQGGGGVPAATAFLRRPSDGHTMMAIGPEEIINHLKGRINLDEFYPISRVQYDQGLFYQKDGGQFKNVEDLLAYAKEHPGNLKIAVTGAGGFDETLVGLWNLTTHAELTAVPFNSGAEAMAAVLGGHVDLLYEEYGPTRGMIQAKKMQPLVIFSEERLPVLPETPTAKELGYDITLGRWRGFAFHQDDDPDHIAKIHQVLAEAAKAPSYKNIEEKDALQYRSVVLGPEEFSQFIKDQVKLYQHVLEAVANASS